MGFFIRQQQLTWMTWMLFLTWISELFFLSSDQFIQPLNGKNFWKFFDPDPENALYVILRWLIVETYKEGINFLQQKESIPNNIFLLMTNCTPWAFIYTFVWFLWLLMRNKKYTKKYLPHIFPSNTKAISSKLCFTRAQVHLGTAWAWSKCKGHKQVYVFTKNKSWP